MAPPLCVLPWEQEWRGRSHEPRGCGDQLSVLSWGLRAPPLARRLVPEKSSIPVCGIHYLMGAYVARGQLGQGLLPFLTELLPLRKGQQRLAWVG